MCNSCASLAGLVLSFIACFILLVIAPLGGIRLCESETGFGFRFQCANRMHKTVNQPLLRRLSDSYAYRVIAFLDHTRYLQQKIFLQAANNQRKQNGFRGASSNVQTIFRIFLRASKPTKSMRSPPLLCSLFQCNL